MARDLLLRIGRTIREKRLEIKYTLLALVLGGGVIALAAHNAFAGIEDDVNALMDDLSHYGALGMFLIALPSNMTLVIQVPYNLPMFSLILYSSSIWRVILLGAATGLGGGIGEVVSYGVAHALLTSVEDLEKSALFRWTRDSIKRRPGLIPWLVWLASATPLPDLVLIVPVAMIKYPWRKMIVPMISGKIVQNVIVALIFHLAADRAEGLASGGLRFDLAALIVVLFGVIIAYQIEKARLANGDAAE